MHDRSRSEFEADTESLVGVDGLGRIARHAFWMYIENVAIVSPSLIGGLSFKMKWIASAMRHLSGIARATRQRPFAIGLIAVAALSAAGPAAADKRVALVVGNAAYRSVARLGDPVNGARLIADTLRGLGFTLVGGEALTDLDKVKFDNALQSFGNQMWGADVALFYYAGYGLQVRGSNHPVDAHPTQEADIDVQMVDVAPVLRQMEASGTTLNVVILDACRHNPFGVRDLLAIGGGLAPMRAPENTLISYAAQPGNVAQEGADGDSPYTKALAQTLRRPGLGILDVFSDVGLAVKRSTGGAQQPWVSFSPIDGSFSFVAAPASTAKPLSSAARSQSDEAAQAWAATRETTNPSVLGSLHPALWRQLLCQPCTRQTRRAQGADQAASCCCSVASSRVTKAERTNSRRPARRAV